MKSGNYRWPYPTHSRPAHRHGVYADPNDRVPTIGFRVVREVE